MSHRFTKHSMSRRDALKFSGGLRGKATGRENRTEKKAEPVPQLEERDKKRREFIRQTGPGAAALLAGGLLCGRSRAAANHRRPNILL